jgi:hypothetical protein
LEKTIFLKLLICVDLVVCALLALPWVSVQFLSVMDRLNTLFSLGGGPINLTAEAFFFVNLAGLFGVAFNVIMLKSDASPVHHINNIARLYVVVLLLAYVGWHALPQIFLLFVVTEILGFIVTRLWLRGASRAG